MKILKVVLIACLIIFGTVTSLSAENNTGIVFSYGGGLGDYNLSYRKNVDARREIEFGFGIHDGKELAKGFPGNLSSKDKPLSDFYALGVGLIQRVNEDTNPNQPNIIARLTFDDFHGPSFFIGGGYEYMLGQDMNTSFLLEVLLGVRPSKESYIKKHVPNSTVEVNSIYNAMVRAGLAVYF